MQKNNTFVPSLDLKHKILNDFIHLYVQRDEISYSDMILNMSDDYMLPIYTNELELVNEINSWFKTNEKINIGKYKGIFPKEIIISRWETNYDTSIKYEIPNIENYKVRFSVDLINEEDSFLDWFKDDNYNINGD